MEQGKQIRLTASEMGELWGQYMNDSASICMLTYFLEKAEDTEIKPVIAHALELSQAHVQKIAEILTEEKNVIPYGFKLDEDVDLTAPRLYPDSYALNFINQMAQIGLTSYATSLSLTSRSDLTGYFKECVRETMELYEMSKDLLLQKGLYQRPPNISDLEQIEYVKKQGFVWDIFGEKRPLSAIEIANLDANIKRNALGIATLIGFSQVAKSKDVTQFMMRGIEIAKQHIQSFGKKLGAENLPVPMIRADVTESTAHTFSDKLMMFYTTTLIGLSIGYYGTAIAQSPRIDLGVMYNKLILGIQKYLEDGGNIMIKNKWLEEPPLASNRKDLAQGNLSRC
ncbi:hypothetical protein JNUCC1_01620 [Lentibacillus sp. JNUCC-1]|uniref:DUF3231 family protein n=1 Tax=Lentibacillus sp. JNUCC-1 TaxID=2654513 RepID=UPI001326CE96|nr:hypothetical protein [Lentibacillus sp. JNUCC-1]